MTLTPKSDKDTTKEKMIHHLTYEYYCKTVNKIHTILKNNMP